MLVGAEQALIAAADALHDRATLSEAEFAALSAHYDEAKIFEIILLCGFYRTVSYLANGLALPLEEKAARFPKVTEQGGLRGKAQPTLVGGHARPAAGEGVGLRRPR